MDKELLGKYIKRYRVEKGLTQAELAESVNVATGMIGRYERGETAPSRDILFELSRILDFSLDALVSKEKIPDNSILSADFINKFNQLTLKEQKAVFKAAEAIIDSLLEY